MKSYPQVSQNSAPAAATAPQFVQVVAAAGGSGDAGSGEAGADAIGLPQTSQ